MRKTIEEIIRDIANNTGIKEHFKDNIVVIFDRTIKERLEDICKLYNADDTNLITYQIKNKKKMLDLSDNIEIDLDINVWSKENQYKTEQIAEKIEEIIENNNVFFIDRLEEENIEDDIYYRTKIEITFIKYN